MNVARLFFPVALFLVLANFVPRSTEVRLWTGSFLGLTYLLDGFLFFYYKKNHHLMVQRKNQLLLVLRLGVCAVFVGL